MNPVPLLRAGPWYRAAPASTANPFHLPLATTVNRFNDGTGQFALLYLAADRLTALREARALYGPPASAPVPVSTPALWAVFEYALTLPAAAQVVDFGDPTSRSRAAVSVQTLTGDWESYSRQSTGTHAQPGTTASGLPPPTHELAGRLHSAVPVLVGFLAPSARNPLVTNLVLFVDRLPRGAVRLSGASTVTL